MSANRCGRCESCIAWELDFLSHIESALWRESSGDITHYLDLMASWADVLVEKGLPQ